MNKLHQFDRIVASFSGSVNAHHREILLHNYNYDNYH